VLVVVPAGVLLTSLVAEAIDLIQRLMSSTRARELVQQLVAGDGGRRQSSSDLVEFVMNQSGRAWALAQQIAGTAARGVIGVVIVIFGAYAILVDGHGWYAWIERHAPISGSALRRLADAFVETGRGLLFGIVGAGLAQSIVATIVYVALGVPQPFAHGLLKLVPSLIPAVGTAVVWVPVAVGLAATGRPVAAVVLGILGLAVIGTVDNLARPYLARRGRLQLPTYVVLVAMFGGIAVIGVWGVIVGPLVVRLAKEALVIVCDASGEQGAADHGRRASSIDGADPTASDA
jgi:predicted PurR-regulated permease PerM